jgi:hypothetical protein
VHVRLDLAPERTIPDVLAIEVFHDHDAWPRRAGDVVEVVKPLLHIAGLAERDGALRLEGHGLGEADDGWKFGKGTMQVSDGIAEAAALRRNDLNQVAHGWGVDRLQKFELGSAWRGHSCSPLGVKKRT